MIDMMFPQMAKPEPAPVVQEPTNPVVRLHIKDGKVINLSAGDKAKPWTPPEGVTVVEIAPAAQTEHHIIGATYDGKTFSKPIAVEAPKEPTLAEKVAALEKTVTELQAKVK